MSNYMLRNMMNQMEFKKETNLYCVEPLVGVTVSWLNLSDVCDNTKGIPLHFEELKGKRLYAKYMREGENNCWKMYIVGNANANVNILYVEPGALNPVEKYNRNR